MGIDKDKLNTRKMDLFNRGDKLTAEKLNDPRKILNGLAGPAPGSQFIRNQPSNYVVRQFKVIEEHGDFLHCVTWDTIEEGTDIISVAKPYLIRRTPFDSLLDANALLRQVSPILTLKYEYSEDNIREAIDVLEEDITEEQIVVPKYVDGDLIYASLGILGGVDVINDDGNIVEWLDTNVDGRFWALKTVEDEDDDE